MVRRTITSTATLPLLCLSITLTGCTGMGSLADILAAGAGVYGGGNEVSGEIQSIDTRRQEIQLQSGWGGGERIRYDGRTQVIYQQRRYDVRDLERGDLVRVRLESSRNTRVASTIQVEQSVRDRQNGRVGSGVERVEGRVVRIDTRQGWFELERSWGSNLMVTLPYDPNRSLTDRFRRLRRGDRVRVEGQMLNGSRMELYRFL